MIREIKFRGKRSRRFDNGEWVYGHLITNPMSTRIVKWFGLVKSDKFTEDGLTHCSGEFHNVDPSTVGQFTGLLDKNGRDIYEGDIIVIPTDNTRHVVAFKNCDFDAYPQKAYANTLQRYHDSCFVIGNIHENPELLK